MPSLDYTLSFHIGLMARVQARREIAGGDEILDFLSTTQRKIYQAQLAFDEADEIEDFQAVGLQCRAPMTSFAREIVAAGDRKGALSGQSVAVRVGLGGEHIIIKKIVNTLNRR